MSDQKEAVIIPQEEKVLIISCLNTKVMEDAKKSAEDNGVEVVILEDKVIHDYLETKDSSANNSMEEFLNNTTNRLNAEEQCVKLWMILTNGAPVETSEERVFKKTEVVKKTTLSHKEADNLFNMFRAFGMLEFVKGTYEFKLNFTKDKFRETVRKEIMAMVGILNSDLSRYRALINLDEGISQEDKESIVQSLIKDVEDAIRC